MKTLLVNNDGKGKGARRALFYVKFFLTAIWFFVVSIIVLVYSLFRWRQPTNSHVWAVLFTGVATKILGFKVKIHHEERVLASQPCVYLANHQDTADLIIIGSFFPPNTSIIGKREMLWIPFFGWVFYACGNIMLKRQRHEHAMAKMKQAEDIITQKKVSVLVFPEGTRSGGTNQLLPFKKGAFYLAVGAQVPLVPVVAAPNKKVIDAHAKKAPGGIAHIDVLEPIPTKGLKETDIDALIEKTRAIMQQAYDRLSSATPSEN